MKRFQSLSLVATAAVCAVMATACTSTTSRGVNDEGRAEEVLFPNIDRAEAIKVGTFPSVENLRKISNGVTKDDLYYLIGRPHFSEMHGAREWDFIFKFRPKIAGPVEVCQYKVIFDKRMHGQFFYWKPASCAAHLNPPEPAPVPVPVVPQIRRFTLGADGLFNFDRGGPEDLQMEGRRKLDKLAEDLKQIPGNPRITVVGHTDRLGSVAHNQPLSHLRAATVRQYLIDRGVPAYSIRSFGVASTQPVVHCDEQPRNALIRCLQPNRRVDVEVEGFITTTQ